MWQGLGLVVKLHTAEIPPAAIAAQFDETGAKDDAEEQPAIEPHNGGRRGRAGAAERCQEDREKARF
jgi:hypothetical protein